MGISVFNISVIKKTNRQVIHIMCQCKQSNRLLYTTNYNENLMLTNLTNVKLKRSLINAVSHAQAIIGHYFTSNLPREAAARSLLDVLSVK